MTNHKSQANPAIMNLMVTQKQKQHSMGRNLQKVTNHKRNKVRKTLILIKNTLRLRKKRPFLNKNLLSKSSNSKKEADDTSTQLTFDAEEVVFQNLSISVSGIGKSK